MPCALLAHVAFLFCCLFCSFVLLSFTHTIFLCHVLPYVIPCALLPPNAFLSCCLSVNIIIFAVVSCYNFRYYIIYFRLNQFLYQNENIYFPFQYLQSFFTVQIAPNQMTQPGQYRTLQTGPAESSGLAQSVK